MNSTMNTNGTAGIGKAIRDSKFLGGFGYTLYYNFERDSVRVVSDMELSALNDTPIAIGSLRLTANRDSSITDLARYVAHSVPLYTKPRNAYHTLTAVEIIRHALAANVSSYREAFDAGVPAADLLCDFA